VLMAMHQRDTELMRSKSAQRAYALICSNKPAITHQIHLRVVREFGLPTSAIQVLQDTVHHHQQQEVSLNSSLLQRGACYLSPGRGRPSHLSSQGGGTHCQGRRVVEGHHSWTLHRGPELLLSMNSCPAGAGGGYDQVGKNYSFEFILYECLLSGFKSRTTSIIFFT